MDQTADLGSRGTSPKRKINRFGKSVLRSWVDSLTVCAVALSC